MGFQEEGNNLIARQCYAEFLNGKQIGIVVNMNSIFMVVLAKDTFSHIHCPLCGFNVFSGTLFAGK